MDLSVLSLGAKLLPILTKSKSLLDSLQTDQKEAIKAITIEIQQQYGDKLPDGFGQLLDYWTNGEDTVMAKLVTTAAHPAVRPLIASKLSGNASAAPDPRSVQEQIIAMGGLPTTCPNCHEIIVVGAPSLD